VGSVIVDRRNLAAAVKAAMEAAQARKKEEADLEEKRTRYEREWTSAQANDKWRNHLRPGHYRPVTAGVSAEDQNAFHQFKQQRRKEAMMVQRRSERLEREHVRSRKQEKRHSRSRQPSLWGEFAQYTQAAASNPLNTFHGRGESAGYRPFPGVHGSMRLPRFMVEKGGFPDEEVGVDWQDDTAPGAY